MNLKILASLILALSLYGGALASKKLTSDDDITDFVRRKLASDPVVKGGAIQVDVKQGAVTLHGTVQEERQKEKATKLAKKVAGVKSVDNELQVVERSDRK